MLSAYLEQDKSSGRGKPEGFLEGKIDYMAMTVRLCLPAFQSKILTQSGKKTGTNFGIS